MLQDFLLHGASHLPLTRDFYTIFVRKIYSNVL